MSRADRVVVLFVAAVYIVLGVAGAIAAHAALREPQVALSGFSEAFIEQIVALGFSNLRDQEGQLQIMRAVSTGLGVLGIIAAIETLAALLKRR